MATKAMQAAVLLMQRILLASAIYLTIIIVYLTPAFTWDWKVAGLALPVAMLSIKVVTSITPLMMLSLYTETFANKNVVDSLIEASKLEKIAKAAKLLHAMRSRALILRARLSGLRKKEEAKALPTYDELMKTLEGDKRKKAIDLKEAFDKFDTNRSDELDLCEIQSLMMSLGVHLDQAEISQIQEELDYDHSGCVSFAEFAAGMLKDDDNVNGADPCEIAEEIFQMLDKDASGSLTVNELQDAFEQMHSGLTDADILTIMSDLDDNQTGQIDREEFVNFFGRMFAEQ